MSLGDLVISISADTSRFQSDLGKASQSVERWSTAVVRNSKQAEAMIVRMSEAGMTSIDRLQREFNSLGVTTQKSIEGAAFASIASFVKIKESGVAAFGEIERAESAARAKLSQLPGVLDTSGASVGKLSASFAEMGKTAISKMEQMKEQAHRDFVAMQMSGEASAIALNAAFTNFQGAEAAVKNLRHELELVNAEMKQLVVEQSLAGSFKGLGVRTSDEIGKERQEAVNNFNNIKNSNADPKDIERAYTAMQDTLQRLEKETLTVAERAAADRIALAEKVAAANVAATEKGLAAAEKAAADEERIWNKLRADAIRQEGQRIIEAERVAAAKVAAEEKAAAEQVQIWNKLRADSIRQETQRIIATQQAAIDKAASDKMAAQKAAADEIAVAQKAVADKIALAQREVEARTAMYARMFDEAALKERQSVIATERASAEKIAATQKAVAEANAYATKNQGASSDRMQGSFDTLGIKSSLNIEAEKAKIMAAFNQIKTSGVASANEIKEAMKAMKAKIIEVESAGSGNMMKGHTNGINLLSLASIAAIAKVQIMYSLINQTMSLIGSLPKTAIDAIETFQSSMVKNAAVITSMHGGVTDIGKAYQENRAYAEAVQHVLVKMDAHTIASYAQLQLMNDAFVQQGVYIDINNKKQLEGYQNVANALATISAGMSNPDMQFSQEIRGLMNGEDKPTNMLFRTLKAVDPLLKEHLKDWKQVAAETGNAGYVLEKLGPLLVGFAAASGDIDSLWSTVKSTMSTIRDEVLRGGLKEGFEEIVVQMKEMNKYADANKEKIQAFLRDGFADAKTAVKFIWDMRDGFKLLGEAALFSAVVLGISTVIEKLKVMDATFKAGALYKALSNPAIAAIVIGAYGGSKFVGRANEINSFKADANVANRIVASSSGKVFGNGPAFTAANMETFQNAFPMDGPELLALAKNKGAAQLVPDNVAGGDVYKLILDLEKIKKLREGISQIKTPKAPKGAGGKEESGSTTQESSFLNKFSSMLDSAQPDSYAMKLGKINTEMMNLKSSFDAMSDSEKKAFADFQKKQGFEGDPLKWLKDARIAKLNASEEVSANDYASKLDKVFSKSEPSEFQKKLAEINAQLQIQLDAYDKLDEQQKFLLMQKGVDKSSITEGYKGLTDAANIEFHQMINKELTAQEVAVLKVAKSYKAATEELIAFENAESKYSDMSIEERGRKFLNDNERVGFADNKDVGEFNKNQRRISREQRNIQNAIGGNNYGSQLVDVDNEFADEEARIKEHYESVVNLQKDATAEQLALQRQMYDEMANNDAIYAAQKNAIGMTILSDSLSIAKQGFAESKTMSVLIIAMETAMSIARIVMNSAVAKSAAVAAAQMMGPLSPAMEAAATARISMYQAASIGMVLAAGAIEGIGVAGKRALGGPVVAGQTYIVNENRASQGPEYFTPGVNGVITPANKVGGGGITINQTFSITGVAADLMQNMKLVAKQAGEQTKADILNSMNRGGEFALASGRVR